MLGFARRTSWRWEARRKVYTVRSANEELYRRAYGKIPIFSIIKEYLEEKGIPQVTTQYGATATEPYAGCKSLAGPMSRKMWEEVVCPMMIEYAKEYGFDLVVSYQPEQEPDSKDVIAKLYFWHRLAVLTHQFIEILYKAPEGKWVPNTTAVKRRRTTGSADK